MGLLVYVIGGSGTGKTASLRNFPKKNVAVVNVQGKILPFKGASAIEQTSTDNSAQIMKALEIYAKDYKSIVVDDYQYVMSNEFMRRSAEKGYDKFTEIARHAWDIAMKVRELPEDVIVYIMCHTDRDDSGNEKIKTIGKLLDEKICLEGLSTIVLKTNVSDGQYTFLTQNNGKDTVKSPFGMFPAYAIDNDLWYVDQKIRNYYEFEGHASDADVAAMDQAVAKPDVTKEAAEGKRRRRSSAEQKPAMTDTGTGAIRGATPEEWKQIEAEEKQKEAEQAIAEATAEPAKRRRKARNAEKENQTEEAPAEEKKEEAAAETTDSERENRRSSRRTSGDRNTNTKRDEVSEEAAAEQPAEGRKRRRKKRDPEEQQKELDGLLNVPEMDDEELPFV